MVTLTVLDNQPPTVSLDAAESQAGAPVTVTLTATAADADGSVAKLAFYNGATLLGTATAAPYSSISGRTCPKEAIAFRRVDPAWHSSAA
jgi:hypothetical protein